jgi:hypothetical protein
MCVAVSVATSEPLADETGLLRIDAALNDGESRTHRTQSGGDPCLLGGDQGRPPDATFTPAAGDSQAFEDLIRVLPPTPP